MNRRGFVKSVVGAGLGLGYFVSKAGGAERQKDVLNGGYDSEWDEAIEEDILREQVCGLTSKFGTAIEYFYRLDDGRRCADFIAAGYHVGKNFSARHFNRIKDELEFGLGKKQVIFVTDRSIFGEDYYERR